MSVSLPDRSSAPGRFPVGFPSDDDLDPVDQHPYDADRIGDEPRAAAGEIVDERRRFRADRLGVEDEQVGEVALRDLTAVTDSEQRGRLGGHHLDRALEADQLAVTQAVAEKGGRVIRPAHPVEVRAGIGTADHGAGVLPDLDPRPPRGVVAVGGLGPEHRSEVVGDDQVEERVEGGLVLLGGDRAHVAPAEAPGSPVRRCPR